MIHSGHFEPSQDHQSSQFMAFRVSSDVDMESRFYGERVVLCNAMAFLGSSLIIDGTSRILSGSAIQMQCLHNQPVDVLQQFNQTTPWSQALSSTTPPDFYDAAGDTMAPLEKARLRNPGQAHNLSNQEHAKTKMKRRDRRRSTVPILGYDGEVEDNQQKYREKNRSAAAKCRAKKKANHESLEKKYRNLSATNTMLMKVVQELRDEMTSLRTLALDHQDCNCQIVWYNMRQAKKIIPGDDLYCPLE